jgi:tripartite-type tricarboxylate transporter receptor subunit TctC
MLKYIISIVFSLFITQFALSKETIVVHSKYAVTETAHRQLQFVVNVLNKTSEKYNFRINMLNGAFGEASIRRSVVDSRSGVKNIIFTSVDVFTVNKELESVDKNFTYDKNKDYILLQGLSITAHGLVSALPVENIGELVDTIKNQNEFFYGYSANSVVTKMAIYAFLKHYNLTNGKPVTFKSQNDLHFSVLNKEVSLAVTTPEVLIASGHIRLLLSTSRTKSTFHPNIPTGIELGVENFVYNPQTFFAIPKEFQNISKEIGEELRKVCLSEDYTNLAFSLQRTPSCLNPEELKIFIDEEYKWFVRNR